MLKWIILHLFFKFTHEKSIYFHSSIRIRTICASFLNFPSFFSENCATVLLDINWFLNIILVAGSVCSVMFPITKKISLLIQNLKVTNYLISVPQQEEQF